MSKSGKKDDVQNKAQFFTTGLPVFIYLGDEEKTRNKAQTYEEDIGEDKFFTGTVSSVNQEKLTAKIINDRDQRVCLIFQSLFLWIGTRICTF